MEEGEEKVVVLDRSLDRWEVGRIVVTPLSLSWLRNFIESMSVVESISDFYAEWRFEEIIEREGIWFSASSEKQLRRETE